MNERIQQIRKKLKLSRAAFGEKLGVSGDVINNLERGRVPVKPAIVKLICSCCNVNENWLLTGEGGPDVVFNTAPESDIDKILKGLKPEDRDRILIEKFLALPDAGRQAVMEYALKVAAAAQEEIRGNAVHKDSTEAAEADYRSSSGFVQSMGLSASNTTGGTASLSGKTKEETTTASGGGESGNNVG